MTDIELLDSFHKAVVEKKAWGDRPIDRVLYINPDDPKTIHTFHRSLRSGTLDPDTLLINACVMAVRGGREFLPYVGQALQAGANPNIYAEHVNPDGSGETLFVHICALIWLRAGFSEYQLKENAYIQGGAVSQDLSSDDLGTLMRESQSILIVCLAMLVVAGADFDKPVTTPKLLMEKDLNPTRFALEYPKYTSSLRSFYSASDTLGRDLWFANQERLQLYSEQKGDLSNIYQSQFLNPKAKENLYTIALFLDHAPILTLESVYESPNVLGMYFKYQCITTLLQLATEWTNDKIILKEDTNPLSYGPDSLIDMENRIQELNLLDLTLQYFNLPMLSFLLDTGILSRIFTSNYKTRVIMDARFYQVSNPVQTQILNTMLVEMADYGVAFDRNQLALVNSYSRVTGDAIEKKYDMPIWKNACKSIQANDPTSLNPDILEISRQVNIPLGTSPTDICAQFEEMYKIPKSSLLAQLTERQGKLIRLQMSEPVERNVLSDVEKKIDFILQNKETLSIDEIQTLVRAKAVEQKSRELTAKGVVGEDGSSLLSKNIFGNPGVLARPIEDYPDIDRVIYKSRGKYWIILSESYKDILTRGINPWIDMEGPSYGERIPEQVLLEVQRKSELIEFYGLSPKSGSIALGVNMLYASSPERTKEFHQRSSRRRLDEFLQIIEQAGYNPDSFEALNEDEILEMANRALSPPLSIVVMQGAPTQAVYDFADAFLWDVKTFSSLEDSLKKFSS